MSFSDKPQDGEGNGAKRVIGNSKEDITSNALVNRRKFLTLVQGVGGATALTALSGCLDGDGDGGDGADGGDGGDGQATTVQGDPSPGDPEVVTITTVPANATLYIYIAQERGYFAERNIQVELVQIASASDATAQMATGQLDGAGGATGASTMNAIAEGVGIKSVVDRTRHLPDRGSALQFLVREEEYTDGMTIADTAGLTWCTNAKPSVGGHHVSRALNAHGLTYDDIAGLEILPFPQMVSALDSGAVDVAQVVDPLASVARAQAGAKHLEYCSQTSPDSQVAHLQFGEPFINQRRDVAVGVIEGYILGMRDFFEEGPFTDQMIDIWTTYTDQEAASLLNGMPPSANLNGRVNGDSFVRQQEFWVCQGYQQEVVPPEEIIDNELREEALDNIGRVDEDFVPVETFNQWLEESEGSFAPMGDVTEPDTDECGGAGGLTVP